ncbi:MAG: extracellular solute-binding protein [Bacteroidetes bacterium]|nr:extracellular solute-binding protein [Bacteroidota bacterium]
MNELTFSVFDHGIGSTNMMKGLLQDFEQQEGIRVRLEVITWDVAWPRLVEFALYQNGPDVSEVGNTWIMDLVHMNALSMLTNEEIANISGGARFFEPSWKSCVTSDGEKQSIWAVPWTGDVRVVYYRRDLLKNAGIEEAGAFANPAAFEQTLKRLKESGVITPLAMQTRFSRISLQNMAAWIWGMGGDFISDDARRVLFHQGAALAGIKSYFQLGHYFGPQPLLDDGQTDEMFWSGNAAVALTGYWVIRQPRMPEHVRANLGVAQLPGVSFVGGHNLVVWKHSRRRQDALRLVKFLSSQAAEPGVYPDFGLPIRENGWSLPPFNTPQFGIFRDSLNSGRCFQNSPLWALVEKRLAEQMPEMWMQVIKKPEQTDSIVETQLVNMARRLEIAISG